MTRRELRALPIAGPTFAHRVFPGVAYRPYSGCLPDYVRALTQDAYERRNGEIAKLSTSAAIARRQQWARDTFWKLIGDARARAA